jgi:hypothetical protein
VFGLGWVYDPASLEQHLVVELNRTANPYGLANIQGRSLPRSYDDTNWGMGATDWSALALILANDMKNKAAFSSAAWHATKSRVLKKTFRLQSDDGLHPASAATASARALQTALRALPPRVAAALGARHAAARARADELLAPCRAFMDNFRSRIRDQWNLVGLTTTSDYGAGDGAGPAGADSDSELYDGQSYCTSHCTCVRGCWPWPVLVSRDLWTVPLYSRVLIYLLCSNLQTVCQ